MFLILEVSVFILTVFPVVQSCGVNCVSVNCTNQYCNQCKDGWFPYFGNCVSCENDCKTCISETICSECMEGSFIVAGSCHTCPTNCKICNETAYCSECKHGYYGTNCAYDCNTCQKSECDKNYCTYGCLVGQYQFDTVDTGICFPCSNVDMNCEICNRTACTECKSGYFVSSGRCVPCTGEVPCGTCSDGKWGENCGNDCVSCIDNVCNKGTGECTSGCLNGFYKGPSKQCTTCAGNCVNGVCDPNDGTCTVGCSGRYSGSMCQDQCANTCQSCTQNDTTRCTHCYGDYYGIFCNRTCSENCVLPESGTNECDELGNCILGCKNGFVGKTCQQTNNTVKEAKTSPTRLTTTVSNQLTTLKPSPVKGSKDDDPPIGAIAGGAGSGVVVIVIVVVVVCLVLRRRNRQPKNNETAFQKSFGETNNYANENQQGAIYAVPNKLKKNNTIPIKALSSNYDNVVLTIPSRLSHLDDNETDVDAIDIEDIEEEVDDESIDIITENEIVDPKADTYYNVAGLKRSRMLVQNLTEYVEKKTKLDFDQEFQKFPKGLTRPYIEARKTENLGKNRYRGIYPYDATRVILRNEHSDFINANYIDGNNQEKAYIAALGPIAATVPSFWEMVWQEKVETIVMLTNLVEGEKMKCEQYWPNIKQNAKYGEVTVLYETDDVYADFVIKRFSVSKNTEKRQVHHMHFTAWPDRSVPDDVTCLLEFRGKVEQVPTVLHGPMVVHCSAGIGRTGTYIGIDMLTKEGKSEGSVDIFGCVMGMRGQRVNMVQTVEQYQYIHDAVLHGLTFNCDDVPAGIFIGGMSTGTDSSSLQKEFQKLVSCDERKYKDELAAIERNSKHKDRNRKGADIPGDVHRIFLKYKAPLQSDYINAVYVNSYKVTNRYIAAQTPLSGTVEDFLHVIVQEGVACIVTMDEDNIKDKSVGVYLPAANQVLKKGPYQICSTMCESTPSYILRKVTITDQIQIGFETKTVYHFQFNSWKQNQTCPNNPVEMLELVKDAHRTASESESTGPILVHCLTGADRSGLFCVVSMLIQKMEADQAASVVNTVRQIRTRRPGAITSLDQYAFCHQCLSTFVKSGSKYANV